MKRIAGILAFIFISACANAQFSYCMGSTLHNPNTTSMLSPTLGWHFYFNPLPETNSHFINHYQVGLSEATGNQPNSWPMRNP